MEGKCPICESSAKKHKDTPDIFLFNCPMCGKFHICENLLDYLPDNFGTPLNKVERAVVSHWIRVNQGKKNLPFLNLKNFDQVRSSRLPTPKEQADLFILWLGDKSQDSDEIGNFTRVSANNLRSLIGSINDSGFAFVIWSLLEENLLNHSPDSLKKIYPSDVLTRLTFKGWERYEELKRGLINTKRVFMAMKFGDETLNHVYENCFKPAVAETDFQLFHIGEKPEAGSIINLMRVEIRNSKFLIADLTHHNNGAYWEAGFAEGLGKKVIYTCKEGEKTHFDTNQLQTVFWDETNFDLTATRLKAAIRATFPTEAKMEDVKVG